MNVVNYLRDRDVRFDLIPHTETQTARAMSAVLELPEAMVAKTVLLKADHGYQFIVAVLPADKSVDLRRLSAELGRAHLALATEAEIALHCPDCEIGVLPPFGSQYGMKTVVDESLLEDQEIVFEANTHHEAIRMTLADYRRSEEPTILGFAK